MRLIAPHPLSLASSYWPKASYVVPSYAEYFISSERKATVVDMDDDLRHPHIQHLSYAKIEDLLSGQREICAPRLKQNVKIQTEPAILLHKIIIYIISYYIYYNLK